MMLESARRRSGIAFVPCPHRLHPAIAGPCSPPFRVGPSTTVPRAMTGDRARHRAAPCFVDDEVNALPAGASAALRGAVRWRRSRRHADADTGQGRRTAGGADETDSDGRRQGHQAGKPGFGPWRGLMISGWIWPSEGGYAAAPTAAIRAIAAKHPTRSIRER
jgi:hypothetical protein